MKTMTKFKNRLPEVQNRKEKKKKRRGNEFSKINDCKNFNNVVRAIKHADVQNLKKF